jgi:cell division protein FtsW
MQEYESRAPRTLKQASPISYHLLWIVTVLLLVYGLCMMLSVSTAGALIFKSGNKFTYITNQGITAIAGIVAMFLVSRANYLKGVRGAAVLLLAIVTGSLLIMHIPGMSRSEGGASSWIPIGPLTFQPSEFAKLAIILGGAHFLSIRDERLRDLRSFANPFGIWAVAICGLVMIQPDLGTATIIAFLLLGLFWLGGMERRQWVAVTVACATVAGLFAVSSGARRARFLSFMNPFADAHGSGYQVVQALYGFARGGWLGVGPGQSVQKFSYLPKAQTDMIFAVIGEELGVIGTTLVIVLFGVFAVICWRLARRCADRMGRYLIAGCGMLVILQAIINIGGCISAMPLTGVPLPFISYGRNSLVVMLVAVGLILSVARTAPALATPSTTKRYENVTRIDSGRGHRRARSTGPRSR